MMIIITKICLLTTNKGFFKALYRKKLIRKIVSLPIVTDMLGPDSDGFWRDHKSSKVNGIRTKTMLEKCDVAVIRFGEKYKQWNAAFDAGYCAALGKPYITLHDENIVHALKEVDASAMAWATSPSQVIDVLRYVMRAG